jgi:hypothetical protein
VREHARLVLGTGLAGSPARASSTLLYDEDQVRELAGRPPLTAAELAERCPGGVCIARLPRRVGIDVLVPWPERARAVARRPAMPTMAATLLGVRLSAFAPFPWVATLCGVIVLCADAHGLVERPEGHVEAELSPPGAWAEGCEGRLLATRPGRPWTVYHPGRAGLAGLRPVTSPG